jgi:hypothetical protein
MPSSGEVAQRCPIPNTHHRLGEAHRLWHQTADAYGDAEGFRTNLNAAIQALRNVTFVLQSEKRVIPDFDKWYEGWRDRMKADPVLRWLIEARNQVVKRGDLEAKSRARAGIIFGWYEPPQYEFDAPPFLATEEIALALDKFGVPAEARYESVLAVERRWVADDLPDWELLDALAHCYGEMALLVRDAHSRTGWHMFTGEEHAEGMKPLSTDHLKGRLPCMASTAELRTVRVHLTTHDVLTPSSRQLETDTGRAAQRYKLDELRDRLPEDPADVFAMAEFFVEQAKRILARDKYHVTTFLLYGPGRRFEPVAVAPADREEKFLLYRRVADRVRETGANAVIFIAEAWFALEEDVASGTQPVDSPNRTEVLSVVVATQDGRHKAFVTPFTRRFRRIRFGETEEVEGSEHFFLEPIRAVWRERDAKTQASSQPPA